ncbi:hypothetical protein Q1695_011394 [Nippostrongylus brasiliensis]|nr:hypothetical protein Q1695_011394 [Nippostrongylus brasiliensis]
MPSEFVNEKLPEILSKLASFREFDKFCDVILEADSSSKAKSELTSPASVRAYKNVLAAASPYFRKTLSSGSYEKSNEIRIVVDDIDGDTLRVLVDYIYSSRIDINEKNVKALFGAAEILQLDCIRNECSRQGLTKTDQKKHVVFPNLLFLYLKKHLSISNCMKTAVFAKAHNCTELDDAAVSFAGQHFGQALLPNVLAGVRLPLMSREFLLNRVYNEPIIQGSSACLGMLGTVFHDMLSEGKTSRVPENWYRPRQTKIVIAGGGPCYGSRLADVNIYNPHSQKWISAAPLLRRRSAFGMATVGDSVYTVGGTDDSGFLRSVEIYDSQKNSWRAGPEMQRCRWGLGVTALNGSIFAVGGSDESQTSHETEMLDPRQGKWISLPSMTNARTHFGLAAVNGLLYAAGGISGSHILNSVEVYDPRVCRWTMAQPMLKKRCHARATVFRDRIVVVGGIDERKMGLSSAEMLTDNGWTFLPEMSQRREGLGVVNVDGSLFAFGGFDGKHHLSSIEYLDFDSNQWEMSQARFPCLSFSFSPFWGCVCEIVIFYLGCGYLDRQQNMS